eukprot:GAHX01001191.1.p1 GENE.GAHX01001191.1~~GAHX01001191.1.p1  ORF type:complete len:453 (+),score=77.26 GAHX01001191.1:37-1395(+)
MLTSRLLILHILISHFICTDTSSSSKIGLDDSLSEHLGYYQNKSITRLITLTDKTETHKITYRIISQFKGELKEPYLIFVPKDKVGHLVSLIARTKLLTHEHYTTSPLRPSLHSDFSLYDIDYSIYEIDLPQSLVKLNEPGEFILELTIKYIKPFIIDNTNLVYRDYTGVFSIYITTMMITKLDYTESAKILLNYTGSDKTDLPISLHTENKLLVYGPYKDLVPMDDSSIYNIERIEGLFKTHRGIPEINKLKRTIKYNYFSKMRYTIGDNIVLKKIYNNNNDNNNSIDNNIRFIRLNFNNYKNIKIRKDNVSKDKYYYDKASGNLLVKFDRDLKPQEEREIKYDFSTKTKSIGLKPYIKDHYIMKRKIVVIAPLFFTFKKINSKHSFLVKRKRVAFFFNNEYAVYEDSYVDTESDNKEDGTVEAEFELDKKEVSKLVFSIVGVILGFIILK